MKLQSLLNRIIPPCKKCPYKLGLIKTPVNPCPLCKLNGYKTYEQFQKQITKESRKEIK